MLLDSFSVHPYDYLLKPINKAKLKALIKEIAEKVDEQRNNTIIIKRKSDVLNINQEDILFIEKYGNEAHIHTGEEIYQAYQSLDEFEKSLNRAFLRSHKSYLINLDKVLKVSKKSNRSYQVSFYAYDKTAMMSRDKYRQYLQIIGSKISDTQHHS